MAAFPCWICEQATDGIDSYVICDGCIAELDTLPSLPWSDDVDNRSSAPSFPEVAPSREEIDARIRKLLDDW